VSKVSGALHLPEPHVSTRITVARRDRKFWHEIFSIVSVRYNSYYVGAGCVSAASQQKWATFEPYDAHKYQAPARNTAARTTWNTDQVSMHTSITV